MTRWEQLAALLTGGNKPNPLLGMMAAQNPLYTADPTQTVDAARAFSQGMSSAAIGSIPGSGVVNAAGIQPRYDENWFIPAGITQGPNIRENLQSGNYLDAGLQGLGILGDAASVGAMASMVPKSQQRGAINLFHEGPDNLPMNKPSHNGNWFGTDDFFKTYSGEFGDTRYSYKTPDYVDPGIIDLSNKNDPRVRSFVSDLAKKMYPKDSGIDDYIKSVMAGDDDAFSYDNLYEFFSSGRDEMSSILENSDNLFGVKYGDEFFLSPKTIERLNFLGKSKVK